MPVEKEDPTVKFLAQLAGTSVENFLALGALPEQPADLPSPGERMPGVMAPQNQPEFWADAPWRLEPDQKSVPVTFYIRDGNIDSPGYGPWRLDAIRLEQLADNAAWEKLAVYLPSDLPGVDAQGNISSSLWFHTVYLPLPPLPAHPIRAGETLRLRVMFMGSASPYQKPVFIERHLGVLLAPVALPQGRAARRTNRRTWFYGDTHYHSAYTNDIKEFGAPLPETRAAAIGIGLDWVVVTDHSCDLDEVDAGDSPGRSRWERLKAELAAAGLSDSTFRFILGEEITLAGKDEKYVHMLAMGDLQALIPGGFLPDKSERLPVGVCIHAFKQILRFGKGYPPNLVRSLFGRVYSLEEVISFIPPDVLLFAAHPYGVAQLPPALWDPADLDNLRLTGHEFWNTRVRRSAIWTDNPFTRVGWTDGQKLAKKDRSRIQILKRCARSWDAYLQRGVDAWEPASPLPEQRPVFIGGSDAHGDFNYHAGMAWNYMSGNSLDDNALGKVRTAVYLPDHQANTVPEVKEILAAIKKGSCVVTDGPLLECTLRQGQQVAQMGEALIGTGNAALQLDITGHTTPEFGDLAEVEMVVYSAGGRAERRVVARVHPGQPTLLDVRGRRGYLRLEAVTTGPENAQYCCFTNPIWFRLDGAGRVSLQACLA